MEEAVAGREETVVGVVEMVGLSDTTANEDTAWTGFGSRSSVPNGRVTSDMLFRRLLGSPSSL